MLNGPPCINKVLPYLTLPTLPYQVSHRYCLQSVDIPDNKPHYFGEKGEIIFHLDFVYHTSGVRTET